MLLDAQLNTSNISIERPIDHLGGGDANKRELYRGLRAQVRTEQRFIRPEGSLGVQRTIVTKMRFQPRDAGGNVLDFQAGDWVRYPDYRGIVQEREITLVSPINTAIGLDHLLVEAETSVAK